MGGRKGGCLVKDLLFRQKQHAHAARPAVRGDGAPGGGDDDLAPWAVLFDLRLHPQDVLLRETGMGDEDPIPNDVRPVGLTTRRPGNSPQRQISEDNSYGNTSRKW